MRSVARRVAGEPLELAVVGRQHGGRRARPAMTGRRRWPSAVSASPSTTTGTSTAAHELADLVAGRPSRSRGLGPTTAAWMRSLVLEQLLGPGRSRRPRPTPPRPGRSSRRRRVRRCWTMPAPARCAAAAAMRGGAGHARAAGRRRRTACAPLVGVGRPAWAAGRRPSGRRPERWSPGTRRGRCRPPRPRRTWPGRRRAAGRACRAAKVTVTSARHRPTEAIRRCRRGCPTGCRPPAPGPQPGSGDACSHA